MDIQRPKMERCLNPSWCVPKLDGMFVVVQLVRVRESVRKKKKQNGNSSPYRMNGPATGTIEWYTLGPRPGARARGLPFLLLDLLNMFWWEVQKFGEYTVIGRPPQERSRCCVYSKTQICDRSACFIFHPWFVPDDYIVGWCSLLRWPCFSSGQGGGSLGSIRLGSSNHGKNMTEVG
jgi:hypothetical protein